MIFTQAKKDFYKGLLEKFANLEKKKYLCSSHLVYC